MDDGYSGRDGLRDAFEPKLTLGNATLPGEHAVHEDVEHPRAQRRVVGQQNVKERFLKDRREIRPDIGGSDTMAD